MVKMHVSREGTTSRRTTRLLVRVVFFGLVVLMVMLVLVLFEWAVRWQYRNVVSTSHGYDYFLRKSIDRYNAERNPHGFRGVDFADTKGNAYRVVVIGDSLTWGQGVLPCSGRFTELAEKMFRERFPGIQLEILNLGIPGYNLRQHIYTLSFVRKLKPDFVLYQWYVNDMDDDVDVRAFHAHRLVPSERLHNLLKSSSVTYILLFRAWNQIRTTLGLQKTYTAYLVDKFRDRDDAASVWAADMLHRLITGIHKDGTPTGIVLFPQLDAGMREYQLDFLHERVLDECQRQDIICLDLRKAYAPFEGHMEDLWANQFDAHPGTTAHRIAAKEIVEVFGPYWKDRAGRK